MTGSLGTAWRALSASPQRILVPTLVVSTAGVVGHVLLQHLLGVVVAGSTACPRPFLDQVVPARCGPSDARAQLTLLLAIFLLYLVGQLVVAGIYRAALDVVDEVPVRSPFAGWVTRAVLAGAAVSAALMTLGTIFLLLPAVVLGFLIRYAPLFALDAGLGPVAAVVASARFVAADLGSELWFVVRAVGVLLLGALLLGFGLYVAVPLVLLAQAQRYRARTTEAAS